MNMKRYLLTTDSCPPCVVLHEEKGEQLEQSGIHEIDIGTENGLNEAADIMIELEDKPTGIPALIEKSDDGVNVVQGLQEVRKKLDEL